MTLLNFHPNTWTHSWHNKGTAVGLRWKTEWTRQKFVEHGREQSWRQRAVNVGTIWVAEETCSGQHNTSLGLKTHNNKDVRSETKYYIVLHWERKQKYDFYKRKFCRQGKHCSGLCGPHHCRHRQVQIWWNFDKLVPSVSSIEML